MVNSLIFTIPIIDKFVLFPFLEEMLALEILFFQETSTLETLFLKEMVPLNADEH